MQRFLYEDFQHGMNSEVSPRRLNNAFDRQGNSYHGAFPELLNVDRRLGDLRPAGCQEKLGTTDYGTEIQGFFIKRGFDSDTLNTATDENIYYAGYASNLVTVYRLSNTSPYRACKITHKTLNAISGKRTQFLDLGNYILVYSLEGEPWLIRCSNDWLCTDTATVTWNAGTGRASIAITSGGSPPTTPWKEIAKRWMLGGIQFKIGSTWYYTTVYGITSTLDGSIVELYNEGNQFSVSTIGAATNITVTQAVPFNLPAPITAPQSVAVASGSLVGDYQWAYTYGTYDGFESDLSPWSTMLTLNSQKGLVFDFRTPPTDDTINRYDIDRVHIYRRGGSNGTIAYYDTTIYLPHRHNDTSNTQYWANLDGTTHATSIKCHTGEITGWPTYGVACVPHASYSLESSVSARELILYESHDADDQLTTLTHSYGGSTASTYGNHTVIRLDSYLDNNADSALGTTQAPTDHAELPTSPNPAFAWMREQPRIKTAYLTGNRLFVVVGQFLLFTTTVVPSNRIYVSSTANWRYFKESDIPDLYDDDNQYSGGYIDIGGKDAGVVKLIALGLDRIIAFKEEEVYQITGRSLPSMRINLVSNVPGTSAPESVVVCDQNLVWLHGKKLWLWDGGGVLMELTRYLTELDDANVQNLDKAVGYYWDDKYYLHYDYAGDTHPYSRYLEFDFKLLTQYPGTNLAAPSPTTGDYVGAKHAHVAKYSDVPYGIGGTASSNYIYKLHGAGTNRYNNDTDFANRVWRVRFPEVSVSAGMSSGVAKQFYAQIWGETGAPAATMRFAPRVDATTLATGTITVAACAVEGVDERIKNLAATNRGEHIGAKAWGTIQKWTATAAAQRVERFVIGIDSIHPKWADK